MKIHYIYKVTNLVNGMYYIGKHSTTKIDDGYLGSGNALRAAILEFGEENFRKDILAFCDFERDVLKAERDMVQSCLDDPNCYNLAPGGGGHLSGSNHPSFGKRWKQKESSMSGKLNGKVIWQFSRDGKFIEKHESATSAGGSIGKDHSNIASAARKGRSAYGYLWSYTDSPPQGNRHYKTKVIKNLEMS